MSIEETVKEELKEKKEQIRLQYMGDIRSCLQKQKGEYINFLRSCPQSGRYVGVFVVGLFIGMIL